MQEYILNIVLCITIYCAFTGCLTIITRHIWYELKVDEAKKQIEQKYYREAGLFEVLDIVNNNPDNSKEWENIETICLTWIITIPIITVKKLYTVFKIRKKE